MRGLQDFKMHFVTLQMRCVFLRFGNLALYVLLFFISDLG